MRAFVLDSVKDTLRSLKAYTTTRLKSTDIALGSHSVEISMSNLKQWAKIALVFCPKLKQLIRIMRSPTYKVRKLELVAYA